MKQHDKTKLIGQRFGRWTVIEYGEDRKYKAFSLKTCNWNINTRYLWRCQCDCGTIKLIDENSLKRNTTKSCGCAIRKDSHRLHNHYIRNVWNGIVHRCTNPNNQAYKDYGARGINVCQFIKESPRNLLLILGERFSPYYTVNRIDNDKGYTCGQCEDCKKNSWTLNIEWLSRDKQRFNQRPRISNSDLYITINGITKSAVEWALEYKKLIENKPTLQELNEILH